MFTDGHTRAFVAYKSGIKKIPLYWENEELSWDYINLAWRNVINEEYFLVKT